MGAGKVIIEERTADSVIEQADPGADIQAVPLVITPERNYGNFTIYMGTHAEGIYDYTGGQPLNTETITIDGKVYTYQDILTNVDGNVQIGTDAEESLDNLVAAITLTGVVGTDYATLMTIHPTVTAVKRSAVLLAVIVIAFGPSTIATLEGTTNVTVDGANVSSVADAITITFALSPDGTNFFDDPTTTVFADAGANTREFTQGMQAIRLTGDGPEHVTVMVRGVA